MKMIVLKEQSGNFSLAFYFKPQHLQHFTTFAAAVSYIYIPSLFPDSSCLIDKVLLVDIVFRLFCVSFQCVHKSFFSQISDMDDGIECQKHFFALSVFFCLKNTAFVNVCFKRNCSMMPFVDCKHTLENRSWRRKNI